MSRRAALTLALVLLGAATGCGVPTGGPPETIPPADVPAALSSAPAATTPPATAPPAVGQPAVYLLDGEDVLVPRSRPVGGDVRDQVAELLDELAAGPSAAERDEGLTTAVPAQARLDLAQLSEGTATVELSSGSDAATGQESRRVVAQIVLTATSLPGVDSVLLSQDGAPVEAPLPDGELTTRPLTAADYAGFRTASPS